MSTSNNLDTEAVRFYQMVADHSEVFKALDDSQVERTGDLSPFRYLFILGGTTEEECREGLSIASDEEWTQVMVWPLLNRWTNTVRHQSCSLPLPRPKGHFRPPTPVAGIDGYHLLDHYERGIGLTQISYPQRWKECRVSSISFE